MKKVRLINTVKEFEEFINRTDIEVIQTDINVIEPSDRFHQGFGAVVIYYDRAEQTEYYRDHAKQLING